jgi:patatin-like phospholipase/acyl hydrolase
MPKMRILAIDGGGIRGVYTAVLIDRLRQEQPSLLEDCGLFAGTSTGGILALGLASGRSPAEMAQLYQTNGSKIFDDSWLDDLKDLGGLSGAEYDNVELRKILTSEFGTSTLKSLSPKRVLVSAFDLDNNETDPKKRHWKAKFFHNFPGSDTDGSEKVVDVAMYTSAAPTFFPSYEGYIDGGVVANNPSMAALAQVLDRRIGKPAQLEDVSLLSLGTGSSLKYISGQRNDWGYAQWVKPLIELILDGSVGVADYECRQILGDRYHRLAPVFDPGTAIKMDDYERIPELIELARQVDLSDTVKWLKAEWN